MWKCYYHLIWATRERKPSLSEEAERTFRGVLIGVCRELDVLVHEVGTVSEHVHLAVSIPPKHAVADVVRRVKGASSLKIKEVSASNHFEWQGWQSEYGVLTFGERTLDDVANYVRNQKQHQSNGTLRPAFEIIDRRE